MHKQVRLQALSHVSTRERLARRREVVFSLPEIVANCRLKENFADGVPLETHMTSKITVLMR